MCCSYITIYMYDAAYVFLYTYFYNIVLIIITVYSLYVNVRILTKKLYITLTKYLR